MKNMSIKAKIYLLLFLVCMSFAACNGHRTHTTKTVSKTVKIHVYKTHPTRSVNVNQDDIGKTSTVGVQDDSWIYWYVIMANNNSYYYYSSPTPVTNFSSVKFEVSPNFPIITDGGSAKPVEESEMEVNETEVASEVATNVTPTEVTETETETTTEDASSSESSSSEGSSEGGSSSSSSSDGGGSDGGGGDGGGGD